MGVRQPGVEGHQRNLDAETDQQGDKQHELTPHRQPFAEDWGEAEIHRAGEQGQPKEGAQNEHTGDGGEDQELGGRVGALGSAPDRDQQPEGNQLQLVKQEEQQEVLRQEGPIHGAADQEQQGEVDARPLADVAGAHRRHQGEGTVHQHQGQGEAVDAEAVIEADHRHPAEGVLQLHPSLVGIEGQQHPQAPEQLQGEGGDGDRPHPAGGRVTRREE